jgi:hypothetical protein
VTSPLTSGRADDVGGDICKALVLQAEKTKTKPALIAMQQKPNRANLKCHILSPRQAKQPPTPSKESTMNSGQDKIQTAPFDCSCMLEMIFFHNHDSRS